MAEVELMVKQDTGWRDVLSLLDPAAWAGSLAVPFLRVRSAGDRVTVAGRLQAVTAVPAYVAILPLPNGFLPGNSYVLLGVALTGDTLVPLGTFGNPSELAAAVALAANTDLMFEISFSTRDAFPTPANYPGTAL